MLTDIEIRKLRDAGLSNVKIAELANTSEASIRRSLKRTGYTPESKVAMLKPTLDVLVDQEVPLLSFGDVMITADWHIPVYNEDLVNEMITTAAHEGIENLVIAGDYFNFDSLSRFDTKDVTKLEVEWREGTSVMREVLKTFNTVYFVRGNHDFRLVRALGFSIPFDEAMRLVFAGLGDDIDRMVFTGLDHMWVVPTSDADRNDWFYVCHPEAYSKIPLSTPRALIPKFNSHVVAAHAHHCAVGYGMDGYHVACEAGGLYDQTKITYLTRTTTYPTWAPGYAWIKDGKLSVRSAGWTAYA